jgi:hypothetical protein
MVSVIPCGDLYLLCYRKWNFCYSDSLYRAQFSSASYIFQVKIRHQYGVARFIDRVYNQANWAILKNDILKTVKMHKSRKFWEQYSSGSSNSLGCIRNL